MDGAPGKRRLATNFWGGAILDLHFTGKTEYAWPMAEVQESPVVIDWTDCPVVEVNPLKLSGVPILKGTRMQADGIVENYLSGMSADEIADVFELPVEGVRALLAYAEQRTPAVRP